MAAFEIVSLLIIISLIGIFFSIKKSERSKLGLLSFYFLLILLIWPIVDYCNYNAALIEQEKQFDENLQDAIKRNEKTYSYEEILEEK
jgi:hypothetical protein